MSILDLKKKKDKHLRVEGDRLSEEEGPGQ